jgi:predicted Zn-dependent peptidase
MELYLYRKSTLPNGVRIITETMPYVRSASLGIWADVGSAAERHDQRGISHLVEHMLFKGTHRRNDGRRRRQSQCVHR